MMALIGRAEIEGLIPHSGIMCLLDAVHFWDSTKVVCLTTSHRRPDHPLASNGRLDALCGIEYASQAMAVHGGLCAGAIRPTAGYLASVRDVACRGARLDLLCDDLEVTATMLASDAAGAVYGFILRCGTETVLRGRAAVVLDAGLPRGTP
jgi:predicted hotdog family 3-hydroxylacyl-ACP dehydratase